MAILRSCVTLLALSCVGGLYAPESLAQAYPSKVVRYVVTDAPGSAMDNLARIVAEGLSEVFGHQVIVDNRAGAGGNIGAEIGARAPADGYTMLQVATTHAVNASLYRKLGYNLVRDFSAVTQLASGPSVAVVPSSSPVKSIGDLVVSAKSNPGRITYASAGVGTCTFLAGELFKRQAGVDIMHVPYKGGPPAVTAVISGETSVYFAPLSAALPHIRQGRLRALAVSTAERLSLLPEYPTIAEAGVSGYRFTCWYGLLVPAGTPRDRIAAIHGAVTRVLNNPAVQKRLGDLGFIPVGDRPEEFAAHIKSQIASFQPIVRDLPSPQ